MLRCYALGCTALAASLLIPFHVDAIEFSTSTDSPVVLEVEEGSSLELDLEKAYEIALARNLDLQVGRYDLAIVRHQHSRRLGRSSTRTSTSASTATTRSPRRPTALEGALGQRDAQYGSSLPVSAPLMPTGGNIGLTLQTRRTETNSTFYFLNPSWYTRFGATFTQPLLRNFGTLVSRSGIVVAQTNRAQAVETLNLQVIGVLQQVEDAYWEFAAAQVEVDVKEQSLELAERLLEETRERIRVGTSAPIDLVQSEASVATRRQDVILARNARANKEDALKKVLGFETPGEWAMAIQTNEPYVFEPLEVDLAQSIETAIANRPEIRRQQLLIENTELYTKLARNATLPSLDLNASYGFGGVGGTLSDPTTPITGESIETKGGFDDSVDQITDLDFPYWVLGVNLKVPLGNNDAKANLARRRFENHQAQTAPQRPAAVDHPRRAACRALSLRRRRRRRCSRSVASSRRTQRRGRTDQVPERTVDELPRLGDSGRSRHRPAR